MKRQFDKYAAGSLLGAKSLSRNDGHTEAPVYKYCCGGEWTVFYPATSPVATLYRLRTTRLRRWLAGFRRRFAIDTQHQIVKELKQA
ncbi:hypothetical protein [Azotobacter beijerinckii]|uniref:Uncharacterized protein n=1 Tax=Azotobacter beijerinckii TaxID=170623 RepID=A0A1I0Z2P4_9GAMM|nr:hypothetical protein [Azotobacter beijerinckii]SFB19894.1 hypothetical protein SAMN04244571_01759 [Azotobacter beijerinckii]